MATSHEDWNEIRIRYAGGLASQGITLSIERAWATLPDGRWVVLPGATDSAKSDSWWLGFDERELEERSAVGAILLCRSRDGTLFDFGIPATVLREIAPKLVLKRGTSHRQFNVERRGSRFELRMKREHTPLDITARLGSVSWLRGKAPATATAREQPLAYAGSNPASPPSSSAAAAAVETPVPTERFFARYEEGALRPLDATTLEEGGLYLVVAATSTAVPTVGALRRIMARASATGLPSDLSEQHDHYAHGAPRRSPVPSRVPAPGPKK